MCAQCDTTTRELFPSAHGHLCSRCAFRQAEHDEFGHGLAASSFGFPSGTE